MPEAYDLWEMMVVSADLHYVGRGVYVKKGGKELAEYFLK